MKLSSSRNDRLASMAIGRLVMRTVPGAALTREMGVAYTSVVVATVFCGVLKLRLSSSTGLDPDNTLSPPSLHEIATRKPLLPKSHEMDAIAWLCGYANGGFGCTKADAI